MKAMVIETFGGIEKLKMEEIPLLPLEDHEVQIEIEYAAVNPVDIKTREGLLIKRMPHEFPIILGWDAAGRISAVGSRTKHFKVGDEVYAYCRKPLIKWGTYAEYINIDEAAVAHKPKNINFAEAAAIPLVGLTAWQALYNNVKLKKDETILIHAGAGGVGSLAIQFAAYTGATIFTTASETNFSYVKKLGAQNVIDYKKDDFVKVIKNIYPEGIDVVFDTLGEKTLLESVQVLKPGGRIVSLLEHLPNEIARLNRIEAFYLFVTPNGYQLREIGQLIEEGFVKPPKILEMDLAQAGEAQDKLRQGMGGGKIVLKIYTHSN